MTSNRSGLVALVIAGLALVIAGAGTAVAVTSTRVTIGDPSHPNQRARVDPMGRLNVGAPAATLNTTKYLHLDANFMTVPTKATIAVTRLAVVNNGNNSTVAGTNFQVGLAKLTVNSAGKCPSGVVNVAELANLDRVPPGSEVQDNFASPLVFRPSGGAKYCIAAVLYSENGPAGSYYLPFAELSGYVISGAYSGRVTPAARARVFQPRARTTHR